jgi:putative membrane protein
MMGWGNQGYGMGWFGMIFMILFWVVVIAGIIFAIRYLATGKSAISGRRGSDPLEILRERYANGEIDTEEYEERKKVLESGP